MGVWEISRYNVVWVLHRWSREGKKKKKKTGVRSEKRSGARVWIIEPSQGAAAFRDGWQRFGVGHEMPRSYLCSLRG